MAGQKARKGPGRPPSPAREAIREIINDPACIKNAMRFAKRDAGFWLKLYEQVNGRPAQAVTLGNTPGEVFAYKAVFNDPEVAQPGGAASGLDAAAAAALSETVRGGQET